MEAERTDDSSAVKTPQSQRQNRTWMAFLDDISAVVIDNGSGVCKAGFAGDYTPRSVFSSIIGRLKHLDIIPRNHVKDVYVGNEAQSKRGILTLKYPMGHGVVTNWDDMEKIWDHIFQNELHVAPEDQPLLISEAPLNPKANRERKSEVMFETFNVPALCISYPAVLALFATGRINGCIVECGDGVTQIVPIYDGFVISHAISRLDLGGRDLTDYMMKMLNEGEYNISTSSEREIVREIKERLTFVSHEYDQDMLKHPEEAPELEQSYELPDGNVIVVGSERFRTPEALFKPWLIGKEMPGIHQFLFDTLKKCDLDTHWGLHNIFLSGGTTACPGFIGRVKNELRALTPPGIGMRVLGPIERKHFVWIGGSTLASLRRFEELCISKAEYDEHGPSIAHTKCF